MKAPMKPTSFRLPADTLDRIRALALPDESQASVILRGLTALAGLPRPMSVESLASRLESVESRLSDLESRSAPVVRPVIKAPRSAQVVKRTAPDGADQIEAAKVRALELRAEGMSLSRTADALNAEGFTNNRGKPWLKDTLNRLISG